MFTLALPCVPGWGQVRCRTRRDGNVINTLDNSLPACCIFPAALPPACLPQPCYSLLPPGLNLLKALGLPSSRSPSRVRPLEEGFGRDPGVSPPMRFILGPIGEGGRGICRPCRARLGGQADGRSRRWEPSGLKLRNIWPGAAAATRAQWPNASPACWSAPTTHTASAGPGQDPRSFLCAETKTPLPSRWVSSPRPHHPMEQLSNGSRVQAQPLPLLPSIAL